MENKGPEFVTIIEDKERILEAYPDDFETIHLDRAFVHLEKLDEDCAKYQERILLTINGALAITTYDLDYLWNFSMKDFAVLNEFQDYASLQNLRRKEARGFPTMEMKTFNGTAFGVKYFPYQEPVSNAKLLDMLDRRVK